MKMNNSMPCGLDDERIRFEPDLIDVDEAEDPRTDLEKRFDWICGEWKDAQEIDTLEEWSSVRYALYGASQALVSCSNRYDDIRALDTLRGLCVEYSSACIRDGRYEGASK